MIVVLLFPKRRDLWVTTEYVGSQNVQKRGGRQEQQYADTLSYMQISS